VTPTLPGPGSLSAGRDSPETCALTSVGGVKCWGQNANGELGDGTTTNRLTPVDVVGLGSGVSSVSVDGDPFSNNHACALTTAGGVKCWGSNIYGQLGDGTTVDRWTPVDVVGLGSGVATLSAGDGANCVLTTAGGVKCWGYNEFSQLGDGTTTDRWTPVDVVGLGSGVSSLAMGTGHACVLMTAGGVKCWGSGALGDGTTTQSSIPVDVVGLGSGVTSLSLGLGHACALMLTGTVKCWGLNIEGQLGDGTSGTSQQMTPVDVVGLTGATALAAGGFNTCAVTTGGGAKCWG
jgi:alpha-tubulin suppressor-like RCC1 family protein